MPLITMQLDYCFQFCLDEVEIQMALHFHCERRPPEADVWEWRKILSGQFAFQNFIDLASGFIKHFQVLENPRTE